MAKGSYYKYSVDDMKFIYDGEWFSDWDEWKEIVEKLIIGFNIKGCTKKIIFTLEELKEINENYKKGEEYDTPKQTKR